MFNEISRFTLKLILFVVSIALYASFPLPSYSSEGHAHDEPPIVFEIKSVDDSVNAVDFFTREVESHVATGSLEKIHKSAFAARDAATSLTQFSATLPEHAQRELPLLQKRIEAVAVQLDVHGDAGRAPETLAFSKKLREYANFLQQLTGVTVRPGWTPVLIPQAHHISKCPHKANHGGRFTLALQDEYHVEGSYPAAGEFRLHFYDKESCPLPADAFSGKVILREGEQQIILAKAADGSHLVAVLPSDIQLPLSVTAVVKLPHPNSGVTSTEHFSYNFYKLSKAPD